LSVPEQLEVAAPEDGRTPAGRNLGGYRLLALLVLCLFALAGVSRGATLELTPVADTTLIETAPDNNHGGQAFFNSGTTMMNTQNRGLLRFDLSALTPGVTVIHSVDVVLEVVGTPPPSSSVPSFFGLHRVLRSWGEGDKVAESLGSPGLGEPADAGEATWNQRFAGTSETWGTPGGQAGVDYAASASALRFVEAGDTYLFESSPELVDDVQRWVDDPQSNYGWMLISLSEDERYTARRFGSRDNPDFPPRLLIQFEVVPEPGMWALLSLGALALVVARRWSSSFNLPRR
jgi:hypothetical protein